MNEIEIVVGYPPNYKEIEEAFDIKGRNVVFTHGNKIYNPKRGSISPDLMVHEKTHMEQQKINGPAEWWHWYIRNPEFRLSQELEAYRNQWRYALANYNRKERRTLFQGIVGDLSSPIYGSIITKEQAERAISQT